jgi:KDO2-lipid IV(A) lauroyltransferase
MRTDIQRCILLSCAGVAVFLFLAFRSVRLLGLVVLAMAIGILWGYAAASCFLDNLSILSCAAGAILIGLAVDLPIHLTQRFFSARRGGATPRAAVRSTVEQTGRSILIASFTSIAGFATFFFTGTAGLADMAVVAICGILTVTVVMLFVLPVFLGRGLADRAIPRAPDERAWEVCGSLIKRHREPLLTAVLIGTFGCLLVLVLPVGSLSFTANPIELKAAGTAEVVLERIQEKFGSSFNYLILVSEGATPEAASGPIRRLVPRFRELERDGAITSFEGIFSFSVSPEQQAEALSVLRGISAARVEEQLLEALAENGFRTEAFGEARSSLRELLSARPASLVEIERLGGLPFLKRFLRQDGDAYFSVAYLALADRFRRGASTLPLVAELRAAGGVTATGMKVLQDELERHLRGSFGTISLLAVLFIAGVVSLSFRHFGWTALAVLPVSFGVIWFLTALKLFQIPFNLLNVGIVPMVIGLGIDDGVHMVCRYRDEKGRRWRPVFAESGRAVLLTTVTTVCGFGSLSVAYHRGLASVGLLAVIGMAACLAASLTLLPAAFSYGGEGKEEERRRSDDRMERFRPTIYGTTLLPEPLSYFFTWVTARLVYRYSARWRAAIAGNLRRVKPELALRERERLAWRTFLNYGVKIRDYVLFSRHPIRFSRRRIRENMGFHNVEEALARGKGAVLVSPHLGFWDLGGSFLRDQGYKVKALSFFAADSAMERFRERVRRRMGIDVIYLGRDREGLEDTLRLAQALREGFIVAMLGDRVLAGPSHEVTFFGAPRPFPLGPALLARLSGAPIVPVFIVRYGRKAYRAIAETPFEVPAGGEAPEVLGRAAAQIAAVFERYIAAYPDQWYNFFPYWEERGDGENGADGT